jgi:hypothetical protein
VLACYDLRDTGRVIVAVGEVSQLTRRLSSVRSTATPASTLPTVNDTNMVEELFRSCMLLLIATFPTIKGAVLLVDKLRLVRCLPQLIHELPRQLRLRGASHLESLIPQQILGLLPTIMLTLLCWDWTSIRYRFSSLSMNIQQSRGNSHSDQ